MASTLRNPNFITNNSSPLLFLLKYLRERKDRDDDDVDFLKSNSLIFAGYISD